MARIKGIAVKKEHGQHFLRDKSVVKHMLDQVTIAKSCVFEIGCGDGFLTRAILSRPITRLWVFEIDPEWATLVQQSIIDTRLQIFQQDFLTADWSRFQPHAPWTVLANLPYHVTFPILSKFVEHRQLLKEGVIMVQEEVAQKIVKQEGRGYGYVSLYFQYYFEWQLLTKVPPTAFEPPPKIYSRLLYFKPRPNLVPIAREKEFWAFIKHSFAYPRRTLRNNLKQTHLPLTKIDERILSLRAQQLGMPDFLAVWSALLEQM